MAIILGVPVKRTSNGYNTRRFNLPCEALAYMNNHKVYQVTVLSGGCAFTYTPGNSQIVHNLFITRTYVLVILDL